MGIRLTIEGAESISLDEHSIETCKFITDTPDDSNARSTDVVNTMILTGRILTAVDGDAADDTMKIAKWSVVRAESSDSYRKSDCQKSTFSKCLCCGLSGKIWRYRRYWRIYTGYQTEKRQI